MRLSVRRRPTNPHALHQDFVQSGPHDPFVLWTLRGTCGGRHGRDPAGPVGRRQVPKMTWLRPRYCSSSLAKLAYAFQILAGRHPCDEIDQSGCRTALVANALQHAANLAPAQSRRCQLEQGQQAIVRGGRQREDRQPFRRLRHPHPRGVVATLSSAPLDGAAIAAQGSRRAPARTAVSRPPRPPREAPGLPDTRCASCRSSGRAAFPNSSPESPPPLGAGLRPRRQIRARRLGAGLRPRRHGRPQVSQPSPPHSLSAARWPPAGNRGEHASDLAQPHPLVTAQAGRAAQQIVAVSPQR